MFPPYVPDSGPVSGARPPGRVPTAPRGKGQDRIQAGSRVRSSASATYVMPRALSQA
jgi:hypothetical protein